MTPAPRLACEECKRRKIRCNKDSPCSACKTAGLACHTVQRARLPRGKSGKARYQNNMLETRVARIEQLLAQQAETSKISVSIPSFDMPPSITSKSDKAVHTNGSKITSFIANDFWKELSDEVHGLRETLEGSDNEGEDAIRADDAAPDHTSTTLGTGAMLFQRTVDTQKYPSAFSTDIQRRLLELYRIRVDNVYKILHWPTIISTIETDLELTPSFQALKFSINFMAICSITDEEAIHFGLGPRLQLLQRQRGVLESTLACSSLLQNPDLTILQAFVIFLIGLRTCLSGAYTWTLVAVAVRVATALKLGLETTECYTRFDLELRRRLLFAIGILDTHSSLDRGTIPILPSASFLHPPLNINDFDMSPRNNMPIASSSGRTDMSHTAMVYEAMICQRRFYELSGSTVDPWGSWSTKLEVLARFELYVSRTTSHIDDFSSPLEKFQKISGDKILVSLQLILRRPPYKQTRNVIPPWDNFDVLVEATNVLEHHLQPMSDDLKLWAWKNWVQWHALAVVLAELLVRPKGALSERAYAVATKSFHYYARVVADSDSGMLWRPIAKLMRQAQRVRQSASLQAEVTTSHPFDATQQGTNNAIEPVDKSMFQATDNFDFDDWNNIANSSDMCTNPGDASNSETKQDRDSATWLAWDAFLQDLDIPDV
ncbi:hypothetical protein EK21DRAFT_70812 [Setomelanomma holmii]|uniref:Zn(2)-C6 fungal-type domain-containing protein n=1 Tax=Setomelanomma holmii TaxID=210430 RepID=A0A9P4H4C8_9PLEO|nr:hypothetical protein EK21DRAFT_70812 [Setomelanomma holmii]